MPCRQHCCLKLNDTDTHCEKEQGKPLDGRELFSEEGNGEGGGGEDFHLVGDLEGRDGEVGYGNELEGVLDDVEESWDGEFPGVCAEYLRAEVEKGGEPDEGEGRVGGSTAR